MAQHDTRCLICGHFDHFKKLSYRTLFNKMCWNGKMWDLNCKCKKYIGTNLEYLEWKYANSKNKKSV